MHISARIGAAVVVGAALLAMTGCGSDDTPAKTTPIMPTTAAATPSKTPGIYQPLDTGKSQSGLEGSILSVEDTSTRYGPGVVITFQVVNTTGTAWNGDNWSTPTVVYGPAGTPAEHITSLSEGYGAGMQGVIPPGSRQTVKHAYKVSKAELNPAVITAGSVVWQGDFASFQR